MTVKPLPASEPQTIGRYRVLGVLGSGGMGRVLLGIGPDGRMVAIKQIHAHLLDDHDYRARFQREVTASMRVSGAFTAPVVDFDVEDQEPWLASLFVPGVPLDKAIADHGPLPVPAVVVLAARLAEALREIHRTGLVHRDLKPANVILTTDGARVIDFGIAHITDNPSALTKTGTALGSPAYMSPEQVSAQPITAASDMFSLGSLLVMAATGSTPFAAGSVAYTLFNIVHTEPDLARVPTALRDVIARCLNKDPRARPTPAQLLDRIGRLTSVDVPWPAGVREAVQRQTSELATIVVDPDATLKVSDAATPPKQEITSPDRREPARPGPRRKAVRRIAIVTLSVVLTVVAAGIGWARMSHRSPQPRSASPTPSEPVLTRLRNADMCAWSRQALQGLTPSATGWTSDPSTWQWTPTSQWGCTVQAADQSLTVTAGVGADAVNRTGRTIDGLPVLGYADSESDRCDRAVDLASADNQYVGIDVRLGKGQPCLVADRVLDRLVATRNSSPQLADAASLGRVDPCAVVPHDLLSNLIGPIADTPSSVAPHECEWKGTESVRVTLEQNDSDFDTYPPVDLGDGVRAFGWPIVDDQGSIPYTLYYPYRQAGTQREVVVVAVAASGDQGEKISATAESVLRAVIGQLPKS